MPGAFLDFNDILLERKRYGKEEKHTSEYGHCLFAFSVKNNWEETAFVV